MSRFSKFILPVILICVGIAITGIGISQGQNNLFLIGGMGVMLAGVVALLGSMDIVGKSLQLLLVVILACSALGLAYLDYKSIKDPIDFQRERDMRYAKVIERLKDIREAQLAYKSVNGAYCDSFDSLLEFVKNDSFPVIKAIGTVPDTLSEDSAILLGIVSRDTVMIPVGDSVFSKRYLKERYGLFTLDSLPFVPFTDAAKFRMEAGHIEKNNVTVPVFVAEDSKPYDPKLIYRVGSMTEPITTGNWE